MDDRHHRADRKGELVAEGHVNQDAKRDRIEATIAVF